MYDPLMNLTLLVHLGKLFLRIGPFLFIINLNCVHTGSGGLLQSGL